MKHTILYQNPHIQSWAALIQLQRDYKLKILREYVKFRKDVLRKHEILTCSYCGKTNLKIYSKSDSELATIDHIIPISKGGSKIDESNCVIACSKCNKKRGNKDLQEFKKDKQCPT